MATKRVFSAKSEIVQFAIEYKKTKRDKEEIEEVKITYEIEKSNPQYGARENRNNPIILAQKQGVNNFLVTLFNLAFYSLIVDGPNHNTRNTLTKNGFDNEKIITINKFSEIENILHYKKTLFDFLKNDLKNLGIKFGNIFADVVNNHTESIRQIKQIFEMQMTTEEGTFVLTCCLRGVNHIQFSQWNRLIIDMGERNGYEFTPIKVPKDLVIDLESKRTSKYKIKENMSDNGANGKTGRTVTTFYHFKLIDKKF
jgi:hypothetical protein